MNIRFARKGRVGKSFGIAAAAVLITSLAACGSDDGSQAGGDSTLRIGSIYAPVNLDPAQAGGIGQVQPYMTPVYDQLLQLDPEGNVAPMLAKSWEFSADGKSLELKLEEGVKFSDGTAFDAAAVKANLERYKAKAVPPVQALLKSMGTVDVVDDLTVKINLIDGGGAEMADSLAATPGYMISPAAFENPDLDVNPVGTGAYEIEEGSLRAGQSVTYVKREGDYWGGDDIYQVDRLEQIGYTDAAAGLNALRSGQLDMMVAPVSERVAEFEGDSKFNVLLSPTRGYFQMRINMETPALSDVRVRRALAYAVDRKTIGEIASGTDTGCPPASQPLTGAGSVPDLENFYSYDPAKAKALLAEAGVGPIKLKALGVSVDNAMHQVVQSQLKAIGIEAEFSVVNPEQYTAEWSTGKYDISPGSTTLRYPGDMLYRYIDEPTLMGDAPQEVLDAAKGMYDPKKDEADRIAQWENVSRVVVEQVSGATILCRNQLAVVADSDVKGYDKIPGVWRASYDAKYLSVG